MELKGSQTEGNLKAAFGPHIDILHHGHRYGWHDYV